MPKVVIISKDDDSSDSLLAEDISEQEARKIAQCYNNFSINDKKEAVVRADGYVLRNATNS